MLRNPLSKSPFLAISTVGCCWPRRCMEVNMFRAVMNPLGCGGLETYQFLGWQLVGIKVIDSTLYIAANICWDGSLREAQSHSVHCFVHPMACRMHNPLRNWAFVSWVFFLSVCLVFHVLGYETSTCQKLFLKKKKAKFLK